MYSIQSYALGRLLTLARIWSHALVQSEVLFFFPRFYLQAASQVFEDVLRLPQPPKGQGGEWIEGLPVIRLEEDTYELELLLKYTHRRFRDQLAKKDIPDSELDTLL